MEKNFKLSKWSLDSSSQGKTFEIKNTQILELYGIYHISLAFKSQNKINEFGKITRFRGSINLSTEKIIEIDTSAKHNLEYICFKTASGRVVKAGEPGEKINTFKIPPSDELLGFFGVYDSFVLNIGVILKTSNSTSIMDKLTKWRKEINELEEDENESKKMEEKKEDEETKEEIINKSNEEKGRKPSEIEHENEECDNHILPEKRNNIKTIIIISSQHCELTKRFINFLKGLCRNRLIIFPNENFPRYDPVNLEGIKKYFREFTSLSNVEDPDELSIIVFYYERMIPTEIIDYADFLFYFPLEKATCAKNLNRSRLRGEFIHTWTRFLGQSQHFFKNTNAEIQKKTRGFFIEPLLKLSGDKLIKFFSSLYVGDHSIDNSLEYGHVDFDKEIERIQELSREKKNGSDLAFKDDARDFAKNSHIICLRVAKGLNMTSKLPFPKRQQTRTTWIKLLFEEFTMTIDHRNSMTTAILKNKIENDKIIGAHFCNFLCEYIDEYSLLFGEKNEKIETLKCVNKPDIERIMSEISYLMDDFFEFSDVYNIKSLLEIISEILNHNQLAINLKETAEFGCLCKSLLRSSNTLFNLLGHKLIYQALMKNPQHFCLKLFQEEKKQMNSIPLARIVLNNLIKFSSTFEVLDINSNLLRKYLVLLEKYKVFEIKSLFEVSPANCKLLRREDIENLIRLVRFLFDFFHEYDNTANLFALFITFLKSCDDQIVEIILSQWKSLLRIAHLCIQYYSEYNDFDVHFKYCLDFFNTTLVALTKYNYIYDRNIVDYEINEDDDLKEERPKKNEESPNETKKSKKAKRAEKAEKAKKATKATNKKANQKQNQSDNIKKLDEKLIDSIFNLEENLKFDPEKLKYYELYNEQKDQADEILKKKMNERQNLLTENKNLKAKIQQKDNLVDSLLKKNQDLEKEKFELSEKFVLLQEEHKETMRLYSDFLSKEKINLESSESKEKDVPSFFDEDHNDLLMVEKVTDEEARNFIEQLQKTRINMKELRSSICGALKFLGDDLYSSNTHFFYEIIQNAEDNQYDEPLIEHPFLQFTLCEDFILISNNEKGFSSKNIAAICQIGQSSKKGGCSIGQKGLGFKSVFSCSDNPHIFSNPWNFCFKIEPGLDELQYITPYWVDKMPLDLVNLIESKAKMAQTHIYLPLKSLISKERKEVMLNDIFQALDENILLNLSNLKEITVLLETKESVASVYKEVLSEKNYGNHELNEKTFNEIMRRIVLIKKNVKTDGQQIKLEKKFICFSCQIDIPQSIVNEEKSFKSNHKTRILLAFPEKKNDISTFPVYAFMPLLKENPGFKFLINADWLLTTNRESLRENEWNAYIRNAIANFFVWIVFNEESVKERFSEFLPKELKDAWWARLRFDIMEEFSNKEFMFRLFNFDKNKKVFLSEENIRNLISIQEMSELLNDVFIIDLKENNLYAEILIKKFTFISIEHVLLCLENKYFLHKKQNDTNWWRSFFQILNQEIFKRNNDISFLRASAPIFLINEIRTFLPNIKKRLITLNADIQVKKVTWRKDIILLDSDSQDELLFLKTYLSIPEVTIDEILKHIVSFHLNFTDNNDIYDEEEIFSVFHHDLEFFKQYIVNLEENFPLEKLAIFVPIIAQEDEGLKSGYARISETVFPFILAIPIQENHLCNEKIINYRSLIDLEEQNILFSWELFFLRMGSKFPQISAIFLKEYTFHDFDKLSKKSIRTCVQIIQTRPRFSSLIAETEILCKDGKKYALKEVYDSYLINEEGFSCIDVPKECKILAKNLGVTIESSFSLAMKVLQMFVQKKETSIEKFQKWLLHMNSNLNEKNIENFTSLKKYNVPLLYFPSETKNGPYFSIKDVFVSEENSEENLTFFNFLSKQIGKVFISMRHNIEYLPFIFLFKQLGANNQIDFEFLNHFVNELIQDDNIYYETGNRMSLLNDEYLLIFKKVFQLYENLLIKKVEKNKIKSKEFKELLSDSNQISPWALRKSILSDIHELKKLDNTIEINLPFITHTKTILSPFFKNQKNLFACLNSDIINDLLDGSEDFVFFEPSFANEFPRVLAFLNIEYIELNSKISFLSIQKDPLREFTVLSQAFTSILNLKPMVKIVKSNFAGLTLKLNETSQYYEKQNSSFKLTFKTPFICGPGLIYLCDPNRNMFNKSLALRATTNYLKEFTKEKFDEMMLMEIIEQSKEVAEKYWREGQGGAFLSFSTYQITFMNSNLHIDDNFMDVYLESKLNKIEKIHQPLNSFYKQKVCNQTLDIRLLVSKPFIPSNKPVEKSNFPVVIQEEKKELTKGETEIIREKTAETAVLSTKNKNQIIPPNYPFIVDNLENARIGRNAEHYFFMYLNQMYGNYISPKNWVSSNRLDLFRLEYDNFINDSAGYDFELNDILQLFVPMNDNKPAKLLFEVKGCRSEWNGVFFMSKNEIKKADETLSDPFVFYYIVIVENADNGSISIINCLDWKQNKKNFLFTEESYQVQFIEANLKNKNPEVQSQVKSKDVKKNDSYYSKKDYYPNREQNINYRR